MKYYISDTHFGHANIMRHSKRPFASVGEMDNAMIENWNNTVKPNDEVYILGDFCFKSAENDALYFLKRLNGKKYLIVGNHDKDILKTPEVKKQFIWIKDIATITDGDKKVVLCHYPMVEWNGFFRGTLHFYGHIHNNTQNNAYKIMKNVEGAYNVGVDILDFTPRSLTDVIKFNIEFKMNHKKE